jgi:N-acetylglucosamine-6-phosphate deacetylase
MAQTAFRIVNATLVLPDRLVPDGAVDIAEGRIVAAGPQRDLGASPAKTLDADGQFVAPGYVDLHVHGGDNADFMDGTRDAFETVVRAHARHGTTSIVATSTVARHDETMAFFENTRSMHRRGADPATGLARTVGAHLYGPYFAEEKVGCHPKEPLRPPTRPRYRRHDHRAHCRWPPLVARAAAIRRPLEGCCAYRAGDRLQPGTGLPARRVRVRPRGQRGEILE